jgi:patatin-related protein
VREGSDESPTEKEPLMSLREHEAPVTARAAVRELRLAVVLYGGVSLAIYMHGTTKELHRLVKASALAENGDGERGTPSERFYAELLRELAERDPDNVRTRVVVDVIAGTSAGGINGIYLAKALAHNRSQDALRDLWLERGDIKQLLRGRSWVPPLVKAPWLLAATLRTPPLKGDAIAQWMYRALADMDVGDLRPGEPATLMPARHELELFVTTTDFFGYDRDLEIADPKLIHDHAHRHVLAFRFGDGADHFTEKHNGALAFSARATSCFPGAFPPVSFAEFERYLTGDGADLSNLGPTFFRLYALSHADPRNTYFVDGGILDNRPFGHAIGAIRRRPAEAEVDRRLLYLEPDPGKPGPRPPGASPRPLATVLAAVSGIPRKEPILDDILAVSRSNERVRRIRDIVEIVFGPVGDRVEEVVGDDLSQLAERPSAAELDRWRDRMNDEAERAAGFAYATYVRSKISGVVDRYARTICRLSDFPDDCNQAAFVRAVLRSWAERRLFAERDGVPIAVDEHKTFLRTFDLDYGARRLRFVIDGLSWWYRYAGEEGFPTRAELNAGKRTLYEARDRLLDAMEGRNVPTDLTDEVLACFGQDPIDEWVYERGLGADDYAGEHADALARLERRFGEALNKALTGFSESVYERVFAVAEGWNPERRRELLVRFLGFPIWDVLLYPIQAVADVGERDAIEIVRMSPDDSTVLEPLAPGKSKLAGVGVMHFGAFFSRPGRESDYLWGRLDGAERLIGILLGDGHADEERAAWSRRAFAAIVEEEEHALPNARELLDHARRFVTG